jgi:hypothetical protein
MSYQRVKGEPHMVRDSNSRALLFTNREDIQAYERRKAEMESQNSQINTLKQEVSELKDLVRQLLERQENR